MPWESWNFLPKITLLCRINHLNLQILHLVNSFCFPRLRKSPKEVVFMTQKLLKWPRRESSERSRRYPFRSAWKNGRGDRKSEKNVSEPKEITLEATCRNFYWSIEIKDLDPVSLLLKHTSYKCICIR